MTTTEPIPDAQFGIANWQDFINNWREADAEYLQSRTISRFASATTRDAALSSPSPGQFVYDQNLDILEMRSKTGAWFPYRALPQNMAVVLDDGTGVTLAHTGAAGKGVVFSPSQIGISGNLNVLSGVLTADGTGVSIKVGAKVAKLTTDAANLVSDTPFTAPSISLTGTGTVVSAPGKTVAVGTLTADTGTITNINVSGTLSGGTINGTGGTIASVALSGGRADAANGFSSQFGWFYGDGSNAIMRWRNPTGGTTGASYIQVPQNDVIINGNTIQFNGQPWIRSAAQPRWYDNTNTLRGYLGPVIYGGPDPSTYGAADGTVWFT